MLPCQRTGEDTWKPVFSGSMLNPSRLKLSWYFQSSITVNPLIFRKLSDFVELWIGDPRKVWIPPSSRCRRCLFSQIIVDLPGISASFLWCPSHVHVYLKMLHFNFWNTNICHCTKVVGKFPLIPVNITSGTFCKFWTCCNLPWSIWSQALTSTRGKFISVTRTRRAFRSLAPAGSINDVWKALVPQLPWCLVPSMILVIFPCPSDSRGFEVTSL